MGWYRTGTIAIANGSTAVTGTNTVFNDTATGANPGDMLIVGEGASLRIYEIKTVNSATSLTLATPATLAVAAGSSYQIQTSVATSNSGLAKKISSVMDRMLNSVQNWMSIINGSGNVTITDYDGNNATGLAWPTMTTKINNTVAKDGTVPMTGALNAPSIELSNDTPFIDFHFAKTTADYSTRIINTEASALEVSAGAGNISFRINGGVRVGGANNTGGINLYRGNGDVNALWGISCADGNLNFARGTSAGNLCTMPSGIRASGILQAEVLAPNNPPNGQYLSSAAVRSTWAGRGGYSDPRGAFFAMYHQEYTGNAARGVLELDGFGTIRAWVFSNNGQFEGPGGIIQGAASDYRLKSQIVAAKSNAGERIDKLGVVEFLYDDTGELQRGFISQQAETVDPLYVMYGGENIDPKGEKFTILNLRDRAILADVVAALQEARQDVRDLKAIIEEMKSAK